ncbi:tyrosine-type recombinase/integrase [Pseudoduganella ginsengisoli]|nr:integrase arm-type DNA-binding domain-containing protein [Pseudoduganella ginsengisoli]
MAGGIGEKRLTDKEIRAFIVKGETGKKLFDGGGLHLFLSSAGTALWRVKYRDASGKEKTDSLGAYPRTSLAAARAGLIENREHRSKGIDPVQARRLCKVARSISSETTFQTVADAWLEMNRPDWSPVHYRKSARAFNRDVYPMLGKLPIADITAPMIAATMDDIAKRGALETAHRILQHVNGVFRYAQGKGFRSDNPAYPVSESLPKPKETKPAAALTDVKDIGEFLRKARQAHLSRSVYFAHRLCAYTGMRISNVVMATWKQFDLDGEVPVWTIPRDRMKKKKIHLPPHRVPLPSQIVTELQQLKAMGVGSSFLFPALRDPKKHITANAVEKAYRETLEMRGKHVPHGWRSAFVTLGRDAGFDREVLHQSEDRMHDDKVSLTYDRAERFELRIELFTWWGQLLANAEANLSVQRKRLQPHGNASL